MKKTCQSYTIYGKNECTTEVDRTEVARFGTHFQVFLAPGFRNKKLQSQEELDVHLQG